MSDPVGTPPENKMSNVVSAAWLTRLPLIIWLWRCMRSGDWHSTHDAGWFR